MAGASLVTLVRALLDRKEGSQAFVEPESFKRVLLVLLPALVFVGAVALVGIYVAAAFYIGIFVLYFGHVRWTTVLIASIGVPVALFFMRSEEHTSELQSLMRISYAVFSLKTKTTEPQQY